MRSRITPNTDTFHAVVVRNIYLMCNQSEIWYPWKKKCQWKAIKLSERFWLWRRNYFKCHQTIWRRYNFIDFNPFSANPTNWILTMYLTILWGCCLNGKATVLKYLKSKKIHHRNTELKLNGYFISIVTDIL